MPKTIEAIFENGAFKPLRKINIKEHERVVLRIIAKDEWQIRFKGLIEKIEKKTSKFSNKEIESDIAHAIKEVREKTRAC